MLKFSLVFALCLMATAAGAQAPEDDAALRRECPGDYFRFCAGYMPGSPGIHQCFHAHLRELAPGCRDAILDFDRRYPK